MRSGRLAGLALLAGLLSAGAGLAQESLCAETNAFSEALDDLGRRFQATKSTLVLNYEGTYSFLCLEFKGMAALRIAATEGTWKASDTAAPVPACKIEFLLFNPKEKKSADGPVALNKRTLCVLGLPELNMLRYVKLNDELIKPMFGRNRRLMYVESYDFAPDRVRYMRRDLESGEVVTNLPNLETVTRQSFEIGKVLRNLHQAYLAGDSTNPPVTELNFTVNGQVKTFGLHTSKASLRAPLLDREVTVLRGDILGAGQDRGANTGFSVSCLPFREVATVGGDPFLAALATEGQAWYMIPIAGRYELFLGGINCTLIGIHGENSL
ncbi:MAG: hypothetical protein R6X19_05895 [Kiritimatiellia bacterium]